MIYDIVLEINKFQGLLRTSVSVFSAREYYTTKEKAVERLERLVKEIESHLEMDDHKFIKSYSMGEWEDDDPTLTKQDYYCFDIIKKGKIAFWYDVWIEERREGFGILPFE